MMARGVRAEGRCDKKHEPNGYEKHTALKADPQAGGIGFLTTAVTVAGEAELLPDLPPSAVTEPESQLLP